MSDTGAYGFMDTGAIVSTSTATEIFPTAETKPWLTGLPDDHNIYNLIGRVASDWAHVEHLFDLIIWKMLGTDSARGACVTAQVMSAFGRCKAIVALLTHHQQKTGKDMSGLIDKTTELMNKSSSLSDRRNRIVHDPWYVITANDAPAQFRAMPHKDHRFGIHPIDATAISETLTDIKKYFDRVDALRHAISAAL
ncbi:MAG: hypothetical protein WD688_01695 [Candidatus Binatia bacterium]